jgi:uncharacterized DUF497 family protein
MVFEWDEVKCRENVQKHGLDFARCEELFSGPTYEFADDRRDYGEERSIAIAFLDGNLVTIVFTELGEKIRIISMRPANKQENRKYEKAIFG